MRRILLASHHNMAEGMRDTLLFLTGMDHVYAISAYVDDTSLDAQIKDFKTIMMPEDSLVILTDMLGGSVNQKLCSLMSKNVHLICGMNLPLALTLTLYPQNKELDDEVINNMIKEAQQQMIYMNNYKIEEDCEDE